VVPPSRFGIGSCERSMRSRPPSRGFFGLMRSGGFPCCMRWTSCFVKSERVGLWASLRHSLRVKVWREGVLPARVGAPGGSPGFQARVAAEPVPVAVAVPASDPAVLAAAPPSAAAVPPSIASPIAVAPSTSAVPIASHPPSIHAATRRPSPKQPSSIHFPLGSAWLRGSLPTYA